MKFLKNRFVLGCFCVILALLIGFLLVPMVTKMSIETREIVVANDNIKQGTQIDGNMLKVIEMAVRDLPEQFYSTVEEVEGTYATVDIVKGDIINKNKLDGTLPFKSPYLYGVTKGKYAMAIPVQSLAAGLGGKLKEGDVVTILVNMPVDEEAPDYVAYTYDELMYVRVLSITDSEGKDIDIDNLETEQSAVPSIATIEVNLIQSKMLSGFANNVNLHLALAAKGDTELAAELLEKQDKYFVDNYDMSNPAWYEMTTPETTAETTAPAEETVPETTTTVPTTEVTDESNNSDNSNNSSVSNGSEISAPAETTVTAPQTTVPAATQVPATEKTTKKETFTVGTFKKK